jgi:chemotaxis protein MotA
MQSKWNKLKADLKPHMRPPVLGAGFGALLVLGSILIGAHGVLAFFSLEGLLIVGGGVIAVAFMSFPVEDVKKALDTIKTMLQESRVTYEGLHRDAMNIIRWARLVKERGMRALEATIGKSGIDDPFIRYGLNMVVSEYAPEEVRAMMETAADACYERDIIPVEVLESMASHAPAFGMVGTLVGMVTMLCNLGADISNIGSSLAVAFLSTLYGVVSARMIYMPAASKLRQEVEKTHFRNQLITEGMVMLVNNKQPMFIQDRLNSFLRPDTHDYLNVFARHASAPQLRVVNR